MPAYLFRKNEKLGVESYFLPLENPLVVLMSKFTAILGKSLAITMKMEGLFMSGMVSYKSETG